jgi:hypothetical membrane protein
MKRLTRTFGFFGATNAILLLALLILLHWLRSDLDPLSNYVSDYANGSYGTLFRIGLVLHGLGNIAIAMGIATALTGSRSGRRGALLLGITAVGIVVGGIFSFDPTGTLRTITGTIHTIAAETSFPIEAVALLFFAYAFRDTLRWNSFVNFTLGIAIVGILCLTWLFIAVMTRTAPGLAERAVFLVFFVWEIWIAVCLSAYIVPSQKPAEKIS